MANKQKILKKTARQTAELKILFKQRGYKVFVEGFLFALQTICQSLDNALVGIALHNGTLEMLSQRRG